MTAEIKPSRKEVFASLVSEMDEKEIAGAVNFDEHRYILVEGATAPPAVWHYVSGHKTLPGACEAAGHADEPFGQVIYDLDSGDEIPLDIEVTALPAGLGIVTGMTKSEGEAVVAILRDAAARLAETENQLWKMAADRVAYRIERELGKG